jgi:two-component system, OmpR family, alkaline phosphatase synthesis response regulator PhoP
MAKERIVVVDDEKDILDMVRYNLEKEHFQVHGFTSGEEALRFIQTDGADLVVLDLMLPEMDGFEVCRVLKKNVSTAGIPILMLTAKSEESDIVAGLELGADDYVTKPFSPKVLLARIHAALRRRQSTTDDQSVLRIDGLMVDPVRVETTVDGEHVELTATEFRLLDYLARRPGWVFTRSQIIDAIKGSDYPVTERSVDVQVVGLRRKLKSAGHLIETVRGVGYRFKE